MNDARITALVVVCAAVLAGLGRVDGDAFLALVVGSVLRSPVPLIRSTIGR